MLAKLKLKIDKPIWLIDVPEECLHFFDEASMYNSRTKAKPSQVVFFAEDKAGLDANFERITTNMQEDAVFWIAYPKQSGNRQSDLIRNSGWQIVFDTGYRVVSSTLIDENWSAVRIRKFDDKANYKSNTPMAERKTPGIDYVNRTVQLPKDAVIALNEYAGLEAFFNSMSFSHKREYVEAIEEAKNPETRLRRIEKMAEMLLVMQQQKELKKKK
jgi:Uncharacterized protein conserved in bacteria